MVKRALLLLLFVGCIPGRHPVEGAACDPTHPCPDDLFCQRGVCFDDRSAGGGGSGGGAAGGSGGSGGGGATGCSNNLLGDGDFEQNLVASVYWTGDFTLQGATVHGGAYAARMSSGSAGTLTLRSQLTAISAVAGSDHCAEGWVRASGTTGPVGFQLARWLSGPDLSQEAMLTADGTWQKVTQRFAYPSGLVGLTVQVNAPLSAGGVAFVDDVCVYVCP